MLVPYIRSSSAGTFSLCELQYFFIYVLGFPNPSGKKAVMGTIYHKVMEVAAQFKKAQQEGLKEFVDEHLGPYPVDYYSPHDVCEQAIEYYRSTSAKPITHLDVRDIHRWIDKTIEYDEGSCYPLNRDIFAIELEFDIPIEKDWAYYEFDYAGEKLTGQLALKGTCDLIVRHGESLEIFDYKTGQRKDFATGKEKDYDYLLEDFQLNFYHYAMSKKFPEIEDIFCSIYFVNNGGLFTVPFGREKLPSTEERIRKKFEDIKACSNPKTLSKGNEHFICKYCCAQSAPSKFDPELTHCQFIKKQIEKKGIDFVVENYRNPSFVPGTYQAPGSK